MTVIRRSRRSFLTLGLLAIVATASLALPATGTAQFASGDIVIADPAANPVGFAGNTGTVFRVDPATGAVDILATGPPLADPTDVAIDAEGNIVIVDEAADPNGLATDTGAVFSLAPGGTPTLLAASAAFVAPDGVAVDPGGNIVVGDNNANPNGLATDTGAVFSFAPGGPVGLIAASPLFEDPADVAISPTGEITVTDDGANPPGFGTGEGAIFRFTPGGAPTVFSAGAPYEGPDGVAIDADANVLISDDAFDPSGAANDTGAVFKIAPSGGPPSVFASSPQFNDPEHIAIEADGQILVVDDAAATTLFRVDPASGAVSAFSGGPLFGEPEGVAVVPPQCGGRYATIIGDSTKNKLLGTDGADVIWGGLGKDKIKGGKGADRICGDSGKDRLSGQQGKDRLFGGKGGDKLKGGKGPDKLKGGKGSDELDGGGGKDKLSGGPGRDDEDE